MKLRPSRLFWAAPLLLMLLSGCQRKDFDNRPIVDKKKFEVDLFSTRSSSIKITSDPGTFVRFSVEMSSEKISLHLESPEGKERQKSVWRDVPTEFSGISETGGEWTLSFHCETEANPCGSVHGIVSIYSADEMDPDRIRAERLFDEAEAIPPGWGSTSEQQAVEKYTRAAEIWNRTGNHRLQALAQIRIGQSRSRTGDIENGIRAFQVASSLGRKSGSSALQSRALSESGVLLAMKQEFKSAQEACEQALELADSTGKQKLEARAQNCLGEVEYQQAKVKPALKYFQEAEILQRQVNDIRGLAENLVDIGAMYCDLNRYPQAETYFQESMNLYKELEDNYGRGLAYREIGRMYVKQGLYQEALNAYHQARNLIEPMGDQFWMGTCEAGIGYVYERTGNIDEAIYHWNEALARFRSSGVKIAEIDQVLTICVALLDAGRIDQAESRIEQALELCENIPGSMYEALALRDQGRIYQKKGLPVLALENFAEALPLFKKAGSPHPIAELYRVRGQAYEDLGKVNGALESYRQAIKFSRQSWDPANEASSRFLLAQALGKDGRLTEALQEIGSAVNLAESLRSSVYSREMRTSYVDSIYSYYALKIGLLMQQEQERPGTGSAAAFETNEQVRARSLLDSLAESRIDIRQGVYPELLEEERNLAGLLDFERERLIRAANEPESRKEIAEIDREIKNLSDQLDRIQAEIRSKSPNYAALAQLEPLRMNEIQRSILDTDTVLLEYYLGEEYSFVWLVSSEDCTAFTLPARDKIETAAAFLYELLTARVRRPEESAREYSQRVTEAGKHYWPEARRLSEMILGRLAGRLAQKRLLIVADGALQYIPFAALPDPDMTEDTIPLMEKHEIVHLPSASALSILRIATGKRVPAEGALAVFADPVFSSEDPRVRREMGTGRKTAETRSAATRAAGIGSEIASQSDWIQPAKLPRLISTKEEAREIAAEAPAGKILPALNFEARRDAALDGRLSNYRYIHFATHAKVDGTNPEQSSIYLSMVDRSGNSVNGILTLQDIYKLNLPAEMVVLSACESALGEEFRGEGLVGFVRGFFYAGAKRVVASLWKVHDEATKDLMVRFYRGIFRDHKTPADALRCAQLEIWRGGRKDPFFWAAFVLQGEWGR